MTFSILSPRETLLAAGVSSACATLVMLSMLTGFEVLGSSPWVEGDPMLARAAARCNDYPHTTQRESCARAVGAPRLAIAR